MFWGSPESFKQFVSTKVNSNICTLSDPIVPRREKHPEKTVGISLQANSAGPKANV